MWMPAQAASSGSISAARACTRCRHCGRSTSHRPHTATHCHGHTPPQTEDGQGWEKITGNRGSRRKSTNLQSPELRLGTLDYDVALHHMSGLGHSGRPGRHQRASGARLSLRPETGSKRSRAQGSKRSQTTRKSSFGITKQKSLRLLAASNSCRLLAASNSCREFCLCDRRNLFHEWEEVEAGGGGCGIGDRKGRRWLRRDGCGGGAWAAAAAATTAAAWAGSK